MFSVSKALRMVRDFLLTHDSLTYRSRFHFLSIVGMLAVEEKRWSSEVIVIQYGGSRSSRLREVGCFGDVKGAANKVSEGFRRVKEKRNTEKSKRA